MNRRNIFGYLGAAAVLLAVPATLVAKSRRKFATHYEEQEYALYNDGGEEIMPKQVWRTYSIRVYFEGNAGDQFLQVQAPKRDDGHYRGYLEQWARKIELKYGTPATDVGYKGFYPGKDVVYQTML
jgi:hypothetical protein